MYPLRSLNVPQFGIPDVDKCDKFITVKVKNPKHKGCTMHVECFTKFIC